MSFLILIIVIVILLFGFVAFRGSPYVPSKKADIRQAFKDLYVLKRDDLLVDIGSGDGVVLREAAKKGANAVGYEINPILLVISRFLSNKYKNIKIIFADFWSSQLPDTTTVVYVFSASRDMDRIIDKIQNEVNRLKRPIYIISYGSKFNGVQPAKSVGAYSLYTVKPLHADKAQV